MESKTIQTSIETITSKMDEMRILHLIHNCSIAHDTATSQWAKDFWLITKMCLQRRYANVLLKVN